MSRAIPGLLLALLLPAAGAVAADEPFRIGKRELEKNYRVIALAPPEADPYLPMNDTVRAMLEEELAAGLGRSGYTVLPSQVLADIRAAMTAQVGGTTDPQSGRPDAARLAAVREHAFRELWFRHPIDAIASIRIRIFSVPVESDRVAWDGVEQKLTAAGRSAQYRANVSVSSVVVGLYDATDRPLYLHYGGLEPLMRREGDQLLPLPAQQLLGDEKKIRKAVQVAIKPL